MASGVSVQGMCSYCIKSYNAISGEAIMSVIIVRNTISFAIGYGVTPWVTNMGLQGAFLVAAFAGMVQYATVLIMIKYGKKLREHSKPRYDRYLKEMTEEGLAH